KDMIIRGGENIYPREIEELLFQHPSVGEVAVVGLPDSRMGEEVGAFLRPAPGQSLDRNALFDYLREHLSPQKTPRFWYEIEEFPLTGSGKIQKFALREAWESGAYEQMSAA
ncbi:MAG: AMP-dependent synthetase, partial [Pseudomonadota bacterium]